MLTAIQHLADTDYYSGEQPLEDAHHLAERIGLSGMRALTMRVTLDRYIYNGTHPLLPVIRQHDTAAAYITTLIARYTPLPTETVFLAALLQNVGLAVALNIPQIAEIPEEERWQALLYAHESLSGLVVETWKLPQPIQNVVSRHHQLGHHFSTSRDVAALVLANAIAEDVQCGISHPAHPTSDDVSMELAIQILELSDAQCDEIRAKAERLLDLLG